MPVQDNPMTSQEFFAAAHSSIPDSSASSAFETMVATDSSQTDNYWLGEYMDSQAFPQMQYEHLMFQGMNADSQAIRQQQDSLQLFIPPLMGFTDHGPGLHRQQPDFRSSDMLIPFNANAAAAAVDPNAPASILLQAEKQSRLGDCVVEEMIMTTPNCSTSTAPNSMRASPSPSFSSGTTSGDQSVVVKIEDDESPRASMSNVQVVDESTAASHCRTPSPFVEDALRSANAITHRGGNAQSVTYVQEHAPEIVVQQMQLQIHQEHQQLQMRMQAFAQTYGQPFASGHHGEGSMTRSHQETAPHLHFAQPFRSMSSQTLSQVSPHVQMASPAEGHPEKISTKSDSVLQLQQLQHQPYGDNLLVGISGITDQETLQALTDAAASSSLSQDLVFGPNLRSMLIEGSSQPNYSKHELYEPALPLSVVAPSPSTLVMRNAHRSRRNSPYPGNSSANARKRSRSHDEDDEDEEDDEGNDDDRRSSESQPGSTPPFPSSSKTSNKHSYPNNNYPHKCKHPGCDRTFASVGLLKSHVVSHNEDKKYWCNLCSYDGVTPRPPAPPAWPGAPVHIPEVKRYKRNHDLLRHKREQHPPIEVKIQRELERQLAKEARKQKNAAERRERSAVGSGRNGGGRRGEVALTSKPTEMDTAAYMAIARETAMRAYYMNAGGLDPGVGNNNASSSNRHPEQMMQQLQAIQLQQQNQQLQPQYWMQTATTPAIQTMNNALLLQQQQQQQQQQQYHQQQNQHHPRAMTLMDTMSASTPYSTGMSTATGYGPGLLLPTPAPTAHHSRSGSTHGDITASLGVPSVQFPHHGADGDENTAVRGVGPTRRALARSTASRVRGKVSTVDEDQRGENFHPYAGRYRRTLHRW
ncbi:hypothetical protein BGZ70_004027 [Mortierella alpina]|uniref:C2H2-type domain-containing protein n=1 Tax=Mortierella alpina TaxID=64518 RepID=A0A9P6M4V2_MORAP|nr:hypothetical protein BGZ70_004027 [Mortierella alpina]